MLDASDAIDKLNVIIEMVAAYAKSGKGTCMLAVQ